MSAFRDRVLKTMRQGARKLDVVKWHGLVDEAARLLERCRAMQWRAVTAADALPKARYVPIAPTQVVVDTQLLLDLERALAEADMLRAELEEMAEEEIARWRDARIRRRLDEAIVAVQMRLMSGREPTEPS